jgi:hypothetical protein
MADFQDVAVLRNKVDRLELSFDSALEVRGQIHWNAFL